MANNKCVWIKMISVMILINGNPIIGRSAVRKKDEIGLKENLSEYKLDCGTKVLHNPNDGAIPLAIKMLKAIKVNKAWMI